MFTNHHPESCSFTSFAVFYVQLAFMVLLHNAPAECKTKAPSPLFGGKAGSKNLA